MGRALREERAENATSAWGPRLVTPLHEWDTDDIVLGGLNQCVADLGVTVGGDGTKDLVADHTDLGALLLAGEAFLKRG